MKRFLIAGALTAAILFGGSGCAREQPESAVDEPQAQLTDPAAEAASDTAGEGATAAETQPLPGEIVPASDDRPLGESDLSRLTNWQLTLARNEIYARHGRPFQNAEIRKHFKGLSWYKPDEGYNEAILSLLERGNADYILHFQEAAFETPAANP